MESNGIKWNQIKSYVVTKKRRALNALGMSYIAPDKH